MAAVRTFHKYRGEASFTLPRLIEIVREQIPLVVSAQTKYKVTQVPTERTMRFYTANGLVDKPLRREGVHALYGYRHLLQVLAVKHLQSHYLPLVKVRSLVENISNRDLEQMIPDIAPATAAHRGLAREDRRFLEQGRPPSPPGRTGPTTAAAPPAVQPAAAGVPAADEAPADPDGAGDTWHRVEVAPGIELHMHAVALTAGQRERLRGALLREIGVLRGWFDG